MRNVELAYSSDYLIDLGGLERLHPFDIHKYSKIVQRLDADEFVSRRDLQEPQPATDEQLQLVHSPEYLQTLSDAGSVATYLEAPVIRMLPNKVVERAIVSAFRAATGGTILAAELSLDCGVAINIGGGYHHAKPDHGEGFNLFNDIAIAVESLRTRGLVERVLVVDLDVHQGNGTAVCFAGDDAVFTFSVHQRDIYPMPKETSDLDVGLSAGTGDVEYLETLDSHWPGVIDTARPDIVIYQAGCDVLEGDPLASLKMTHGGVCERDRRVVDACRRRDLPVVMLLGGGYSSDAWEAQYQSIAQLLSDD